MFTRKVEKRATVIVVITIPADFTECVERHDPASILVRVNNLNLDFTNDIRRAVPDARETDFATALVLPGCGAIPTPTGEAGRDLSGV
jgi:hypothetical protein